MPSKKQSQAGAGQFVRPSFHANEDGTTDTRDISFSIDPDTLEFIMPLPPHLATFISGVHQEPPGTLRDRQADGLLSVYAAACDDYSRRTLARAGTVPMLALAVYRHVDERSASVELALREVRFNEATATAFDGDEEVKNDSVVIVADTPEVREAAGKLIASIKTAGEILRGILDTSDPVKYLLAIGEWQQPNVEAESVISNEDRPVVEALIEMTETPAEETRSIELPDEPADETPNDGPRIELPDDDEEL